VSRQVRDGAVSELVCLDGSAAAAGGMGTLSDAITLAKEETGAEIRVDFRPLRLAEDKTTSHRAIIPARNGPAQPNSIARPPRLPR
jgi:hypothetical protein